EAVGQHLGQFARDVGAFLLVQAGIDGGGHCQLLMGSWRRACRVVNLGARMPFAKGRRADRQVYRLLGTQIAPRRCRGFAPAKVWRADSAKYGGLMSAGDFWRGLTEPDVGVARLAR